MPTVRKLLQKSETRLSQNKYERQPSVLSNRSQVKNQDAKK